MVFLMRLILSLSALVIIVIDPSEPDRVVFATYLALISYTLYSALFYVLIKRRSPLSLRVLPYSHWIDVAWYIILIALSSGTSSIFFFFFFFAILNASFTYGFKSGFKVTLVSSVSFSVIGLLTSPGGQEFELNRFLLRPVYLTALGYMMALWGSYEITAKHQLALLKEISVVSNPRFGVDRTINVIIELLRDFYKADECYLIMKKSTADDYVYYLADRTKTRTAAKPISREVMETLYSLPENSAVVYGKNNIRLGISHRGSHLADLTEEEITAFEAEDFHRIAQKFDASSFLTLPIYDRGEAVGRLFLFARKMSFEKSDVDFLLQAINQFMPIIENIRLVDHLASSAAEDERRKIARDIHDSIIQPYIGLQLGIDSIINLLEDEGAEDAELSEKERVMHTRIRRLRELTETGISDLRGYISGLSKPRGYEGSLLPAITGYSNKFSKATGIGVTIDTDENTKITDRLAAELFQIIVEGLSNIRRHTDSRTAEISVKTAGNKLYLTIRNNSEEKNGPGFTPRSIAARVEMLGGQLEVRREEKSTGIFVEIPL